MNMPKIEKLIKKYDILYKVMNFENFHLLVQHKKMKFVSIKQKL